MKKTEVKDFIEAAENNVFASISGTKFVYAIHRNIAKLKSLYDSIKMMGEPGDEFKPYLQAQWKLFEKYGDKLPSGKLKVVAANGKFDVKIPTKNEKAYTEEEKNLEENFKEVIKAYAEFNEKHALFLHEEIEPEDQECLHKIKFEDLPENLTFKQLELLNFMITE